MTDASDVSFGGETVKATAAKFAMALTGFVGTILFARILGPEALGGFYLLLALIEISEQPFSGFATAGKKRASETGTPESSVVGAQLLFNGAWTILVLLVTFAVAGWLSMYTGFAEAAVLFALVFVAKALYSMFVPIVQARGRIGIAVGFDALRSYFTLPLQLAFVLYGFGAAGMAYGLGAATFLTVPIAVYYIQAFPALPTRALLMSLWTYARYSIPTKFLGRMYTRFDTLLLGYLLTQSAAGDYGVAARLTLPAIFIANMMGDGLMVRASNLQSKGRSVAADVSNALAFTSIVAIPIFFGALAIPEELIVTFYTPEFLSAVPLLVGIALYRVVRTQSLPLTNVVDGLDRPDLNFRISLVALGINIIAGVFLVRFLGAIGVVVATLGAESIRYLATGWAVRRELSGVRFLPRTLLEQLGAGAIMFAVVNYAAELAPVDSWLDLSVLLALGAAVYGGMLLGISSQLRLTIGSILRGSRVEQLVPSRLLDW